MDYRRPTAPRGMSASGGGGGLGYDSDASTTIDSLKDLMAASQRGAFRHGATREDDLLFAARHARPQVMPAQFREPPSSTGSHGTVTLSSIHDDSTASTFSAGPDAESTRASVQYQRGRYRVHKSTGRFGGSQDGDAKNTRETRNSKNKSKADVLAGVVNTSALFRTFREWQPEDAKDTAETAAASERSDDGDDGDDGDFDHLRFDGRDIRDDSTTNFGILDKFASRQQNKNSPQQHGRENKENQMPVRPSPRRSASAAMPSRKNSRGVLQATVQNESDMSVIMSTAVPAQRPPTKAGQATASPRRSVSAAAGPSKTASTKSGSSSNNNNNNNNKGKQCDRMAHSGNNLAAAPSPILEEGLTSPETSAASNDHANYPPVRSFGAMASLPTRSQKTTAAAPVSTAGASAAMATDSHDAPTNQSFVVPSKSFPLLHNLVTGTLRFTPGTFFYGTSVAAQREYQLPAGRVPADEKKIFVDVEKVREEVVRLQEHDEMLQNEIIHGERKYQALVERFYNLAAKASDSGFDSESDRLAAQEEEQREWNGALQDRILELEAALESAHVHGEEQAQSAADAAMQRDTAVDKAKKLQADLVAARERLVLTSQAANQAANKAADQAASQAAVHSSTQEAQRRVRQLEQMVAERERVIKALRDEGEAAASSHREACRLLRERIARLGAEKNMARGDHAKCEEEKQAMTTARSQLTQKNTALREKNAALREKNAELRERAQTVRQQAQERETVLRGVVERQRAQMSRQRTQLKSSKEKGVRQLDEAFQRLRASWAATEEGREETITLTQMAKVLGQWEEEEDDHDDKLDEDDDVEEAEEDVLPDRLAPIDEEEEQHRHGHQHETEDEDEDEDPSMDENMTSAFIIPDLDFAMPEDELTDESMRDDEAEQQQQQRQRQRPHKPGHAKSVSFQMDAQSTAAQTMDPGSASSTCRHSQTNCVVCRQKAGPPAAADERVTVVVPRPAEAEAVVDTGTSAKAKAEAAASFAAMDPGRALAYVMKLLDDERRHLWMQIETSRQGGAPEADGGRPARKAQREPEGLWQAYVRKVEQLNRLDDVAVGQRASGQAMTREEVDVTITRILGGEEKEW